MEIKQQFVVDGQTFGSIEEAQRYVDSQQERRRAEAFVEHLKTSGKAERISKKQVDFLIDFIKYEASVRDGFELEQEVDEGKPAATHAAEPVDAGASTGTAAVSPSDAPSAAEGKPVSTAAEPEEPSSEPAQAAEETSKHVDGPNEALDEDPLAGLDI